MTRLSEVARPYLVLEYQKNVDSIGYCAFQDCDGLREVYLPDGLERILMSAFWGCISLEKIFIPKSVVYIEGRAFRLSSSLTIYCEAEERPRNYIEGWDDGVDVIWGAKRGDAE